MASTEWMRDILYELNGVGSAFHPILSVIYGYLEIQDLMSLAVYIQQQQQQQHHQLGQQQQQQHKQQQQSSYLHYFIQEKILYLSLIHISEPTRLLSISYAVFCLKKKK